MSRRPTQTRVVRWSASGVLALVVMAGAGVVPGVTPAAAAPTVVAFDAVAGADGLRMVLERPEAPVSSTLLDAALPSAQARVANIEGSVAYASYLYPGDVIVAAPNLAAGATGAPVPQYPVIATSSDPGKPSEEKAVGPLSLRAASTPDRSAAKASSDAGAAGVGRVEASAASSVDPRTATLNAKATTLSSGIDIAGVLSIASVRSVATSVKKGSAAPVTTSDVFVGDVTVAGVRVALSDKGLVLAGQATPLPDSSPVMAPLRDAGVTVTLIGPEKLEGGVRSGGVVVTAKTATPDGGEATVTYLFGGSRAAIVASVEETATAAPPPTQPTAGDDAVPAQAATPADEGAAPAVGAQVPSDPGASEQETEGVLEPEAAPEAGEASAAADAPPPAPADGAQELRPVAAFSVPFSELPALEFYLVLVLAGAVAFGALLALRRYGVSSA